MTLFPFEALNLFRNPFGEFTPAERASMVVQDDDPLVRQLSEPGGAIQFVGECGRGKSSQLLGLSARLERSRFVRMRREATNPPPRERCQVLLMDEVDHVSSRRRAAWAKRAANVAWAVHGDRSKELRRLGFDVLTVRVAQATTSSHLAQIFARRIEACRKGPGKVPQVRSSTVERLLDEHGTDIRAMERELYEEFQAVVQLHKETNAMGKTNAEV